MQKEQQEDTGHVIKVSSHNVENEKAIGSVDKSIYCLIIGQEEGKPTMRSLYHCLNELKTRMRKSGEKKLATTRIGCGKKKFKWGMVRKMIKTVFYEEEVQIQTYNHKKEKLTKEKETQPDNNTESWTTVVKKNSRKKETVEQAVVKKKRKPKGDAILIPTKGSSFKETVRNIKKELDPEKMGTSVKTEGQRQGKC